MHNAIAKIHRVLHAERDRNPHASFQRVWDNCRQQNPQLFGELEAADGQEDDKAEKREKASETSEAWHHPERYDERGTTRHPDYHSAMGGRAIDKTQPYRPGKHYPMIKDEALKRLSLAGLGSRNSDGSLTVQGCFANPL